jgi:erythromycin esterase
MTVRLATVAVGLWAITFAAQPKEPTASQLGWLKTHAIPIEHVEAGTGFADLQRLKTAIGDARIVALGEATHGTREINQLRYRLTEFLASESGFTVVALETMVEADHVNEYVLHGGSTTSAWRLAKRIRLRHSTATLKQDV